MPKHLFMNTTCETLILSAWHLYLVMTYYLNYIIDGIISIYAWVYGILYNMHTIIELIKYLRPV